jgi:arylsulfatase A-like enzyme
MHSVNMNEVVGKNNIVLITLDTLRYDVAVGALNKGLTPNFAKLLPGGWEERHSPATFTYAAHQAFFSGFLPTPASPGKHERLFAADFEGSETTSSNTYAFKTADIISGFKQAGYKTVCIGGVGFFNKKTALGNTLPGMFDESYWRSEFGVTNLSSTYDQFAFAKEWIARFARTEVVSHALPAVASRASGETSEKFFMFINVSAIHQPNCRYVPGCESDGLETHEAALVYVDSQLPILIDALSKAGNTFCIVCSDHGTAYGEGGYHGHRLSHPTVLTVPYAHFMLNKV